MQARTPDNSNSYELISALFIRLLALIFFSAFFSIATQIEGLAGSQGILPIEYELAYQSQRWGDMAWWHFPSLFWFNASDLTLLIAAYSGCVIALLLVFNIFPRLCLALLLILYLSLYHAGQIFMNFQWDILLLEAGFLALFLSRYCRYTIWLFRWLLFRLRFLSGISKLLSGDPSWLGLTAISYYFEVQPLPTPVAWYANQLPTEVLVFGALLTLLVEIIVPFMMFLPRKYRFFAAWVTIFMQLLIMMTSNHNWFNLLTLALCLFLFDDQALRRVLPDKACQWLLKQKLPVEHEGFIYRSAMPVLLGFIVLVSSIQFIEMLKGRPLNNMAGDLVRAVRPFAIVNKYHVFPTMKTQRFELLIYGSMDGINWKEYKFKYKPDELNKMPQYIIPHQPRLDWMMWFVTIHPHFLPWFESFIGALFEGSPAVSNLLAENPFAEQPPNFIAVDLYQYKFSDKQRRERTGQWWQRRYIGPFQALPFARKEDFITP